VTPAEWLAAKRRAVYWIARMRELLAAAQPLRRQLCLPFTGDSK